ncbi:hypothetical protein CEXT_271831 [Caerostris extrusa]|uniref:Uncharacterized protein n=1 Tax=Caerostris extrusa TaxID=172846 RepID=A0AAV4NM90_CAEEX|nr:hypothetical protein CEXT_271831 [Caerostris extrusa]
MGCGISLGSLFTRFDPSDFSLWRHLKHQVYFQNPQTSKELSSTFLLQMSPFCLEWVSPNFFPSHIIAANGGFHVNTTSKITT